MCSFNSRTPKGCDLWSCAGDRGRRDVSIHAPLKGATLNLSSLVAKFFGFNSRTPKGCDLSTCGASKDAIDVSIHAPLKGATSATLSNTGPIVVSIHAPLKGATSAINY